MDRRNEAPINRPDHREVEPRVGVCRFQAAEFVNLGASSLKMRGVSSISGQPQPDPRLDCRVQLGRTAIENIPSAIGKLPVANVLRKLAGLGGFQVAKNMQVENVIGFKSCIGRLKLGRGR